MPISSRARLRASTDDTSTSQGVLNFEGTEGVIPSPSAQSTTVELAQFKNFGDAYTYAQTAKLAGRLNAASVSDEEQKSLLVERQSLLDKKFTGTITRKESNRLEYVRWSLDRIEDAKHGQTLDVIEGAVARYEHFFDELKALQIQLGNLSKKKS